MKYKEFGRSGLRVSAVGLGYMGMSHTYGRAADIAFTPEEVRSIDEALDGMEMSEVFGGLKVKE